MLRELDNGFFPQTDVSCVVLVVVVSAKCLLSTVVHCIVRGKWIRTSSDEDNLPG